MARRPHNDPYGLDALVREHRADDHLGPLVRSGVLTVALMVIGTVYYHWVGHEEHGWIDAAYMTVITLTAVGYGETIDMTDNWPARLFTIVFLLVGASSFVYLFSNATAFMVEGGMDTFWRRRRMKHAIDQLKDHEIVCGAGDTGRHSITDLIKTGRPFVVVEHDVQAVRALQEATETEFLAVIGDATTDEVLKAAGIERAHGLIAAISQDKDNLMVTLTARLLNPKLRIVSRCIDSRVEAKIRSAGADAVVSPNMIGGMRMVSEMVRPTVVSFLDIMLRDRDKMLRVEDVRVQPRSPLDGMTVGALRARKLPDLLVMALKEPDGDWVYNPADEVRLEPGYAVVFMGSPTARTSLEALGRVS